MKKWLYIIVTVLIISFGFSSYYFYSKDRLFRERVIKQEKGETTRDTCLGDDEIAIYEIIKKEKEVSLARIFIKNKKTGKEIFSFQIELPIPDHYHPIELHECGVYAVKSSGYDYNTRTSLPGYKAEIWKYNYKGDGEKIVLIAEDTLGNLEGYKYFFSSDFRVDPDEKYIVLIKDYLGQEGYSLVIKNLNTKEDVFVLTLDEILKKYPNIKPGSFALGVWTPDNKYHWGVLFEGSYDIAYYRIELGTWKTDILPSPSDLPSGAERDFNFKGWLAYVDMTSFTGMKEVTEQIEEEARRAGKMKNLWVYNLFTKEKIKIASVDPGWRFNIKWLSDTELEYYLPSGERKVFNVENRGKKGL